MYLDQKARKKIKILTVAYIAISLFALSFGCLLLSYELIIISIISAVLMFLIRKLGKYSEGSAKLINLGNKKIQTELNPREFIDEIDRLENDESVIKGKDDYNVLRFLCLAYSTIGDNEKVFEVIERGISSSKPSSQQMISWNITKMAVLYETGKIDEADSMLRELETQKLNYINKNAVEIVKSFDKAIATGDLAKAEDSCRARLLPKKGIFKETNLTLVDLHFTLGDICMKTGREKEGYMHLKYAIENGGETIYRSKAKEITEKYDQSKMSEKTGETDEKPE